MSAHLKSESLDKSFTAAFNVPEPNTPLDSVSYEVKQLSFKILGTSRPRPGQPGWQQLPPLAGARSFPKRPAQNEGCL